jgi:hypothetical protein
VPEDVARPLGGGRRAEATALPGWIKPQLTKLVDQPPNGSEWLHELKFDGYRMHARLDRGAVRLLTRTGLDGLPNTRRSLRQSRRFRRGRLTSTANCAESGPTALRHSA